MRDDSNDGVERLQAPCRQPQIAVGLSVITYFPELTSFPNMTRKAIRRIPRVALSLLMRG